MGFTYRIMTLSLPKLIFFGIYYWNNYKWILQQHSLDFTVSIDTLSRSLPFKAVFSFKPSNTIIIYLIFVNILHFKNCLSTFLKNL